MRILMLSWEYPPYLVGGLGKHVADLAPTMSTLGLTVFVVTPLLRGGDPQESSTPGLHIVRVKPPATFDLTHVQLSAPGPAFVLQLNHELEQVAQELYLQVGGFDLIHTHDWLTATAAISLKQRWHVPLIATIHATERGRGRGTLSGEHAEQINSIEWRLTYEAWRVIVCSKFMQDQIADYFRTPLDKIDIIPNGVYVSPDPFANDTERLEFRRRFATDDEQLAFSIGRIVYEKGLHILIDSWVYVVHHFKAHLIIAGTGPYTDILKAQVERLRLHQYIHLMGFISDEDRHRLYHAADVAVIPSIYEPFGIVSLEASAAECPVVVSETGGLMEVVRLHETGIIVTPNHIESLAWGILHTFQHPYWSRARAINALHDVRENYNWLKIARTTIAVYQHVMGEWRQSSWGHPPPAP